LIPSHASSPACTRRSPLRGWNDELCDAIGITARAPARTSSTRTRSAGRDRPRRGALAFRRAVAPARRARGLHRHSAVMLPRGRAPPANSSTPADRPTCSPSCTSDPKPHARVAHARLGVGEKWMSVATLASARLDDPVAQGHALRRPRTGPRTRASSLANSRTNPIRRNVRFDPHLPATARASPNPPPSFSNLTLATTRRIHAQRRHRIPRPIQRRPPRL
jgi:hypothetical protein